MRPLSAHGESEHRLSLRDLFRKSQEQEANPGEVRECLSPPLSASPGNRNSLVAYQESDSTPPPPSPSCPRTPTASGCPATSSIQSFHQTETRPDASHHVTTRMSIDGESQQIPNSECPSQHTDAGPSEIYDSSSSCNANQSEHGPGCTCRENSPSAKLRRRRGMMFPKPEDPDIPIANSASTSEQPLLDGHNHNKPDNVAVQYTHPDATPFNCRQ
ncbi:hypothetical protein GGR57DRAFT_512500 [Xylariaceae sp. FL1272]|nr:hypothetical protein GGR57DRAFT_512500 [Xylariaceae sp. FL1272]